MSNTQAIKVEKRCRCMVLMLLPIPFLFSPPKIIIINYFGPEPSNDCAVDVGQPLISNFPWVATPCECMSLLLWFCPPFCMFKGTVNQVFRFVLFGQYEKNRLDANCPNTLIKDKNYGWGVGWGELKKTRMGGVGGCWCCFCYHGVGRVMLLF